MIGYIQSGGGVVDNEENEQNDADSDEEVRSRGGLFALPVLHERSGINPTDTVLGHYVLYCVL